uniref:CHAT domain-containing protein n=1 Tax=Candidatus Kentrum sp. UNK TaxID=2126344 RepID=A0A451AAE3_9GAMM|nr:MAG: CHAT domain-containing protein [Candidatus Kentron sp. UNK]VFK70698.1 MAG: CHAT domain-containing protein [Candidatus Kentron sp. UNK]
MESTNYYSVALSGAYSEILLFAGIVILVKGISDLVKHHTYRGIRLVFDRYRKKSESQIASFRDRIGQQTREDITSDDVNFLMNDAWRLIHRIIVANRTDLIDQLDSVAKEEPSCVELLPLSRGLTFALQTINTENPDDLKQLCRDYLDNEKDTGLLNNLLKAFVDARQYDKALLVSDVYLDLSSQDGPNLAGLRKSAMSHFLVLLDSLSEYESEIYWCEKILEIMGKNESSDSLELRELRVRSLWYYAGAHVQKGRKQDREKAIEILKQAKETYERMLADDRITDEFKNQFTHQVHSFLSAFQETPDLSFQDKLYQVFGIEVPVSSHENPDLSSLKKNRLLIWLMVGKHIKGLRDKVSYYAAQGHAYGVSYWLSQIADMYSRVDPDTRRQISFKKAKKALDESLHYAEMWNVKERIIYYYYNVSKLYMNRAWIAPEGKYREELYDKAIEQIDSAITEIEEITADLPTLYRWSIERAYFLEHFAFVFLRQYELLAERGRFWDALRILERLKAKNLLDLVGLERKFYDDQNRQHRLHECLLDVMEKRERLPWVNWFQGLVHEARMDASSDDIEGENRRIVDIIDPNHLGQELDEQTAIAQFLVFPRDGRGEILLFVKQRDRDPRDFPESLWTLDHGFMFSRHRFGIEGSSNPHQLEIEEFDATNVMQQESKFFLHLERLSERWQETLGEFESRVKEEINNGPYRKYSNMSFRPIGCSPTPNEFPIMLNGVEITDDELDSWNKRLSSLMKELLTELDWDLFLKRQISALKKLGIRRLVIIPHHLFSLYPIHAFPGLGNEGCLIDTFDISYGPSLGVMLFAQSRQRAEINTQNIVYVHPKGEFEPPDKSSDADEPSGAKIYNLEDLEGWIHGAREASILQFDCHGTFDSGTPLRSSLGSSTGEVINAAEVFLRVFLPDCHLVFLNACNTGERQVSAVDEQAGLEAAFLQSGAKEVISTLWPVENDVAEFLLQHLKSAKYSKSNETFCAAIRELKKSPKHRNLLSWAPFIHSAL